jgi:predicted nucleic acid-binding protein
LIYFDATYIARIYLADPGWEKVRSLALTDEIACCVHGRAETSAVFHRKFREGLITAAELAAFLQRFEADSKAAGFHWLPLGDAVLERVATVYAKLPATIPLRAADALHLASAAQNALPEIYSNDTRLLAAAAHFGLAGKNVI